MKTLRERIEFVKETTNWSNAELARRSGVSRAAPTDWLNGNVGVISSMVAQALSQHTPFTVGWLATGSKPMYKAESEIQPSKEWPFPKIDEAKVYAMSGDDAVALERAFIVAASNVGLDIKKTE